MAWREEADDPLDRGPDAALRSSPSTPHPRSPSLEAQHQPSGGPTTTSHHQKRGHHRRTSSLTSPPPPPDDFNPPADFSIEDILHGIQAPPPISSSSTTSTSRSSSPSSSIKFGPGDDADSLPQNVSGDATPTATATETFLQRPQIRAIQRLSQESVGKSNSSSRSASSAGGTSDGGDVLMARREELKAQLLTSDVDTGRRSSGDTLPADPSSTPNSSGSSTPGEHMGPVEVNVIGATPSHSSVQLTEDALREAQAEGIPRRRSFGSTRNNNAHDDGGAHAWDSVWPVANSSHVVSFPPTPSRFPSAPMSPYVTPSFSPAVVQTTRRLSSSPPHSPAPRLFGEGCSVVGERANLPSSNHRVLQAQRPAASTSLHPYRSERSSPHSPTTSPRLAPSASPSPPSSSPDAATPGSPSGGGRSRSWGASGSPNANLLQTSPTLPPTSNNGRRSRGGERSSSFINQFPELTPPFISGKELLSSPAQLVRRLSETAITRRPDASLTLDRHLAMSAVLTPLPTPSDHLEAQGSISTATAALLSPAPVRPSGPRRARSAQDARDTQARLATTLSLTPAPLQLLDLASSTTDASPPRCQPQGSEPHHSPPLRPPSPISFSSPAYAMYENAIEDDVDDDDDDRPEPLWSELQRTGDVGGFTLNPNLSRVEAMDTTHHSALGGGLVVDEGDLLPTDLTPQPIESDITFDDEGLTTLERIFLLSRSEYSFHRAYAARVLGELLGDVDPCESVEYVIPLVSGFSVDEDESVKEAFAADFHRILWYFFSTCQLVAGEDAGEYDVDELPEHEDVLSRHSSSLPESVVQLESAMRTPGVELPRDKFEAMFAAATTAQEADTGRSTGATTEATQGSSTSPPDFPELGPGSSSSGTYQSASGTGTAPSTSQVTEAETALTSHSASDFSHDQADGEDSSKPPLLTTDSDKLWHGDDPEVVEPPVVFVDFFRPLLGTLLLSQNPTIADPVRAGLIAIISRLRRQGPLTPGTWGSAFDQPDEERQQTFLSQTGPHTHILGRFDAASRSLVEQELLHGIVLGLGKLSTEVPESLFDNSVEVVGDDSPENYAIDRGRDEELYRQQMIHEATLGRALSLSFIGSVCEMYSPAEVEQYGFVDEVIRGLDGDASTRAEGAFAMSTVLKAAPEGAIERLQPVFELYANDEEDQVRQAACVCMPPLCKRKPQDAARREFAVNAMATFMSSHDSVRYAALEVLGEVIYAFDNDPDGPPAELIALFCDDSESEGPDSDWDVLASFNFPGVCLTLGAERWGELRELFQRIVKRGGDRVFRTVSAFLHELAQILTPEQVAEDVLPVYRICLGRDDEIRERIFEHVDVLIARLPPAQGWQSFLRLSKSWTDDVLGGWRAREQLALHIPSFLETFREHDEVALVLDMMRSALLDQFAAVRDAATYAVPRTYDIVQRSQCSATTFYDMVLEFSHSPRYRQRLTFVRCLREFMRPPPNKRAFEQFFMPALARLATDIIDVRLGLAQAIADLFILGAFYGDRNLPVPEQIKDIVNTLADDVSSDVRNALKEVGADRWASNDNSLSASEALSDASSANSNPENLAQRVQNALAPEAEDVSQSLASPHNRAQIASPLVGPEDDDDVLSVASPDDPFEASFAQAQAQAHSRGRSSTQSNPDEVLAAAHRATTLPDTLNGSPPLTPTGWGNNPTPTYGLGIVLRQSPEPARSPPM